SGALSVLLLFGYYLYFWFLYWNYYSPLLFSFLHLYALPRTKSLSIFILLLLFRCFLFLSGSSNSWKRVKVVQVLLVHSYIICCCLAPNTVDYQNPQHISFTFTVPVT